MEFLELLKPPLPTSPDEICKCIGDKPVKLMCALSYNPICCIDCNLEVEPSPLTLIWEIVQHITFWRNLFDAIDRLELASGEYELWAQAELSAIHSAVNRRGLAARAVLDPLRRCYYWYWQDQSIDDFKSVEDCPLCGETFSRYSEGIFPQYICESCSIITVA